MADLLWRLKDYDLDEIETDELSLYRRALQEAVGGHLRAYRAERIRLSDVEKELQAR